jgi:hypothetical protein
VRGYAIISEIELKGIAPVILLLLRLSAEPGTPDAARTKRTR